MKQRIVLVVVVALLVGVALLVYFGQKKSNSRELFYSGTIEATESNLAFQTAGRVNSVAVREGEQVVKDQPLAELDSQEFHARIDQAKAALARTIKEHEQTETLLMIYEKTLPAEVERAKAGVENAKAVLRDNEKNYQRYEQLFSHGVVSEKERDAFKLTSDTARTKLADAEAVLKQAKSNLARIDAARTDVESALAQVVSARATLEQAAIQMQYTQLKAPYAGIITSRNVESGEVVTPSREVLTLADLSTVDLKIFVDETEIGQVKPGQRVEVKVDTFPDRSFPGRVSFISPEGEFTPKIIQTRKERVKLVYLVKISLPNPTLELKSGMPADAWLR